MLKIKGTSVIPWMPGYNSSSRSHAIPGSRVGPFRGWGQLIYQPSSHIVGSMAEKGHIIPIHLEDLGEVLRMVPVLLIVFSIWARGEDKGLLRHHCLLLFFFSLFSRGSSSKIYSCPYQLGRGWVLLDEPSLRRSEWLGEGFDHPWE